MRAKQAADYHSQLRAIALDYYYQRINFVSFMNAMYSTIVMGLNEAWAAGASSVGIQREITPAEDAELYAQISNETAHINRLADAIDALRISGRDVSVITRRLELWGEAYTRVQQAAMVTTGSDTRLIWTLHPAEHCADCIALEGQVHTASEWYANGVYPKSWGLACRQGCKCTLEPTTFPITGTLGFKF
jgi:hypothetical protein